MAIEISFEPSSKSTFNFGAYVGNIIHELAIQGSTLKRATQKAQFKIDLYFIVDTLLMTWLRVNTFTL